MVMLKNAGAALATIALSGCAALPPPTEYRGVSVNDLVDAVQCELRAGAFDNEILAKKLTTHVASAELELRLTDTSRLGASAVWVAPSAPELLTASLGVNSGGVSARTAKLQFSVELKNLGKKYCDHSRTGLPAAPNGLGLADWVRSAFWATRNDDVTEVFAATYRLEFTLTQGADGGITVLSSKFKPASIGGAASREDKHILQVTMAPKSGPQTQQVMIVNWPEPDTIRKAGSAVGGRRVVPMTVGPSGIDKFRFSLELLKDQRPQKFEQSR